MNGPYQSYLTRTRQSNDHARVTNSRARRFCTRRSKNPPLAVALSRKTPRAQKSEHVTHPPHGPLSSCEQEHLRTRFSGAVPAPVRPHPAGSPACARCSRVPRHAPDRCGRRHVTPPVLRAPAGAEEQSNLPTHQTSWFRRTRRNFSNLSRPSGFERMSATFPSVGTNSGRTASSSTSSRILRCRRSMCFVRELDT